jgi:uncharacterized protein (TIGR03086 family)
MTGDATTGPAGLLERAIGYGLESMDLVTAELLSRPTPCADWDLHALLLHLNDSIGVLSQGIESGCVDLGPCQTGDVDGDPGDSAIRLVAAIRTGVRQLRHAWKLAEGRGRSVDVAGHRLTAGLVAITGAIEITVHGWDVFAACGGDRPIPEDLAFDLLVLCPLLVDDASRHPMFATPVPAPPPARPGERLVAFLGRDPAF